MFIYLAMKIKNTPRLLCSLLKMQARLKGLILRNRIIWDYISKLLFYCLIILSFRLIIKWKLLVLLWLKFSKMLMNKSLIWSDLFLKLIWILKLFVIHPNRCLWLREVIIKLCCLFLLIKCLTIIFLSLKFLRDVIGMLGLSF